MINPSLTTSLLISSCDAHCRISRVINLKDCDQLCVEEVRKLIKYAVIFPVDFYFKNATDLEIRQWAAQLEINKDVVNEGFITLNHTH